MNRRDCDIAVYLYEPGDGGLDRVAILLANGFAARGLATEIWLTRSDGRVRHLISPDVRVRMIPAPRLNRGVSMAIQLPMLRRVVRSVRPKILLSAGNQSNLPVALACRGTDTAAIGKITNPIERPDAGPLRNRIRRRRFGATMATLDHVLTLSRRDADAIAAHWPHLAGRVAFAPIPIVTVDMAEAREDCRARGPIPHLLILGRLAEQKDHATLLTALSMIADRPWHLDIVGDGPLRPRLEAQCAALDLQARVRFHGFQADILPALHDADLMILSSRWEGLGAVAVEAMACGCPVVATDCAPGLTDLLVAVGLPHPTPPGDAAALARAISIALDHPHDSDALKAMAAPYTIDASVDDHLRLLSRFL